MGIVKKLMEQSMHKVNIQQESKRGGECQCSQPSGAPVGPGGGTAKSPGRDGTAKRSPSSSLNFQDGRH